MACEHHFVCGEKVSVLGFHLEGVGWFLLMILIAFLLQVGTNFLWTLQGQTNREVMRRPINKRGRLLMYLLLWTGLTTTSSIIRIVLIQGNNLFVYLTILVGNLVGVYYSKVHQKRDEACIASDIMHMLDKLDNPQCSEATKEDIDKVLDRLSHHMARRQPMRRVHKPYRDQIMDF
tara:strand:- start:6937 stop:7464 length:528 start_codon:yes stop_codon:yes gene_type:complete